ncbi:MAG: CapA family protein [Patescibacteria group bacterium]
MRIGSFTWWFSICFISIAAGVIWWNQRTPQAQPSSSATNTVSNHTQQRSQPTQPAPTPEPIQVIFTGDVMLDRNIRTYAETAGYQALIGEQLQAVLLGADLVVPNFEGPITENASVSQGSVVGSPNNFRFTFSPDSVTFLEAFNMQLVNLGNNHMNDFGAAGRQSTLTYLDAAAIASFGHTDPEGNQQRWHIENFEHGSIGFVNYNQFVPGGREAAFADLADITPQADFVVVVTHWGNEYQQEPNLALEELAHAMVDAGADLIIGTHQHVIANHEVYQGAEIYYSLGNFVFDQYFSPAVQEGLIVTAAFDFDTATITTETDRVTMTKPGVTELAE